MYQEWSLDVLYKGTDDPALATDMQRLEELVAAYKQTIGSLSAKDPCSQLKAVVALNEELTVLVRRVSGYFSLRRSANSNDTEVSRYMTKIQTLMASTAKESAMFQKYVGSIENLDEIVAGDELLAQYTFYFERMRSAAAHKLGDEAEAVMARMNISGGRAWGDLFSYLTANLEYASSYINEKIPCLSAYVPEGTYLLWIDFSKTSLRGEELRRYLVQECKLDLCDGWEFDPDCVDHMRLNCACTRATLNEALSRLEGVRSKATTA